MSRAVSAQYRVACPTCNAAIREPCRSLKTKRVTDAHRARIDAQRTDEEREQHARALASYLRDEYGGGWVRFLLRLLDAERARADAAEAKAAHLNHILSQYEVLDFT